MLPSRRVGDRVFGLLLACAIILMGANRAARAQPVEATSAAPVDGRAAAAAMGTLFADTCLVHAGDATALRAVLQPPRFRPMQPGVAHALLPRPGQAFELPGSPGHLMVLSFDDGWCGDGGTGIDPAALTNALSDAVGSAGDVSQGGQVKGGTAKGGSMKLMGADPAGREQRYLIERAGHAPVVLLVLLLPADEAAGGPALMQASLFASVMRPGTDASP